MSKGLVLISGLNGYIAAVTAKQFLDNGFSVRGTVRKASSAKPLLEGPLKQYADSGALSVFEVPDITVDGAFDEAVKGVTAVAHLASPVSFNFTDPDPVIKTALHGTLSMLNSALKAGPQLKTLVLLSSIVAVMNGAPAPYTLTEGDWNDWAEAMVAQHGKDTPGRVIYCASKAVGEKAFWKWKEEKNPSFTMTAINPVFVIGPSLLPPSSASAVGETIEPIWKVFAGLPIAPDTAGLGAVVDVRDVAQLVQYPVEHPEETNGERYIASSAASTVQSYADVLRKAFPEAKDRIVEGTPGEGYRADYQIDTEKSFGIDSSKAKKLLKGGNWIGFEESVVDTAKVLKSLL